MSIALYPLLIALLLALIYYFLLRTGKGTEGSAFAFGVVTYLLMTH